MRANHTKCHTYPYLEKWPYLRYTSHQDLVNIKELYQKCRSYLDQFEVDDYQKNP